MTHIKFFNNTLENTLIRGLMIYFIKISKVLENSLSKRPHDDCHKSVLRNSYVINPTLSENLLNTQTYLLLNLFKYLQTTLLEITNCCQTFYDS